MQKSTAIVAFVAGLLTFPAMLLFNYWTGLRNPDFFCQIVASHPPEALLEGEISGEPSLVPLGITCQFPAPGGGYISVQPAWTVTVIAASGIALMITGVVLFARSRSSKI
ncbi:hypothetical protein [Mycetocola zhadangensis]|uniref:Uncharacterized protein n=1 Tax=Mycetocola zhadangensis TaxID=1164595 RepID=A0A3L7J700_9MICO|nr:hypothetical protein [Mycetocola zhadangensis]RLQ84282.1 hypothetical protein D9V28_08750 [Mycetocola zhadangensis]GGE94422.1 hypothetical protein GCM10011313_16730 [Mycetocola zhadangensis]